LDVGFEEVSVFGAECDGSHGGGGGMVGELGGGDVCGRCRG
jgi:hypothetical protein